MRKQLLLATLAGLCLAGITACQQSGSSEEKQTGSTTETTTTTTTTTPATEPNPTAPTNETNTSTTTTAWGSAGGSRGTDKAVTEREYVSSSQASRHRKALESGQ